MVSPATLTIVAGQTGSFSVSQTLIAGQAAPAFSVLSSNFSVVSCTIVGTTNPAVGLCSGVSAGAATVTVQQQTDGMTAAIAVTVTAAPTPAPTGTPESVQVIGALAPIVLAGIAATGGIIAAVSANHTAQQAVQQNSQSANPVTFTVTFNNGKNSVGPGSAGAITVAEQAPENDETLIATQANNVKGYTASIPTSCTVAQGQTAGKPWAISAPVTASSSPGIFTIVHRSGTDPLGSCTIVITGDSNQTQSITATVTTAGAALESR